MRKIFNRSFSTVIPSSPSNLILFGSNTFAKMLIKSLREDDRSKDIIKNLECVAPSAPKHRPAELLHEYLKENAIKKHTFQETFNPLLKTLEKENKEKPDPDLLGVSLCFPVGIPANVQRLFPKGFLHLSSTAPFHKALADPEINSLNLKVMKGKAALESKSIKISSSDNYEVLVEKTAKEGKEMLMRALTKEQGGKEQEYDEDLLVKDVKEKEAYIDWSTMTAEDAVKMNQTLVGSEFEPHAIIEVHGKAHRFCFPDLQVLSAEEKESLFFDEVHYEKGKLTFDGNVEKDSFPGFVFWNPKKPELMCIRCKEGWVTARNLKRENQSLKAQRFTGMYLKNEHYFKKDPTKQKQTFYFVSPDQEKKEDIISS
jgi:methionyl-tRNA formyltransferase